MNYQQPPRKDETESPPLFEGTLQHWPVILATILTLIAVAAAVGILRKPVYTAKTRLYVQIQATDPAAVANVAEASAALAPAYSRAIDASSVIDPVARKLGLSPGQVVDAVSATPIAQSPVVDISATAGSARLATRLANLSSDSLSRYVAALGQLDHDSKVLLARFKAATLAYRAARTTEAQLQRDYSTSPTSASREALDAATANADAMQLQLQSLRSQYEIVQQAPKPRLELLDPSQSASSDRRAKLEILVFLALVAGCVVGLGFAVLRQKVLARVKSPDEMIARLQLPLLGRLPAPPKAMRKLGDLVMLAQPNSSAGEAFRMLRMNLDFTLAQHGRLSRTILVTSGVQGEGKTTTAANLAVAFALGGHRVALVDADLHRPSIAPIFRLDVGHSGLTSVALGWSTLSESTIEVATGQNTLVGTHDRPAVVASRLDVLPSGPLSPNPGELIASSAIPEVIQALGASYDVVILDSPPLLEISDATALGALVDGTVILARLDFTRRSVVKELRRLLDSFPGTVLGLVLTDAKAPSGYYSYGYRGEERQTAVEGLT